MNFLDRKEYDARIATFSGYRKRYWNSASDGRWEYMAHVISILQGWGVGSVLELGSNHMPLSPGSDTMDIFKGDKFTHDAGKVPWPFVDKSYDAFVALQVWEHLEGKQRGAFAEVIRVSKRAVLSFPLGWKGKSDKTHYNITKERIAEWTMNVKPVQERVFTSAGKKRIVMAWEFDDSCRKQA